MKQNSRSKSAITDRLRELGYEFDFITPFSGLINTKKWYKSKYKFKETSRHHIVKIIVSSCTESEMLMDELSNAVEHDFDSPTAFTKPTDAIRVAITDNGRKFKLVTKPDYYIRKYLIN